MPRGTRGSGFNNRRTSVNPFDQKFNTSGLSYGFNEKNNLVGNRYDDFGGYQDIFSQKRKKLIVFLKHFISKGLQKPDEDSTASKIAEGVYKSYRPKEKSSQDKISDLLAARMGLGGGSGVSRCCTRSYPYRSGWWIKSTNYHTR